MYNILIITIFHTVHMWSVLNRIKRDVYYSVSTLYCIHSKRCSRSFTTPPLSQRARLWTSACTKHTFSPEEPYSKWTEEGGNNMLTVCAYLGTIQGEKLKEPEPDLSPICKNKKRPEPGPNGLSVSGPVRFDGLAGLYCTWVKSGGGAEWKKNHVDCNT